MTNLDQDISSAVAALRKGGIIVYPTDTVWGIGCDACNSEAVRKVFEIKRRADSKALITLVADEEDISRYTTSDGASARELANGSERPTTVIYPKAVGLAPELIGEDGSVGMRLTREAVSAAICRGLGRPIVSTSANISGCPAPALYSEISEEILNAADYVVEARRDDRTKAQPSRIIKIEPDGSVTVIRP